MTNVVVAPSSQFFIESGANVDLVICKADWYTNDPKFFGPRIMLEEFLTPVLIASHLDKHATLYAIAVGYISDSINFLHIN